MLGCNPRHLLVQRSSPAGHQGFRHSRPGALCGISVRCDTSSPRLSVAGHARYSPQLPLSARLNWIGASSRDGVGSATEGAFTAGTAATCVRLSRLCCTCKRGAAGCGAACNRMSLDTACACKRGGAETDGRGTVSAADGRATVSAIIGRLPVVAGSRGAGGSTGLSGTARGTAFEREATCPWTGCPAWETRDLQSRV
jgi:hypothetical protein